MVCAMMPCATPHEIEAEKISPRVPAAQRGDMSRAEAAVRSVTHEWVLGLQHQTPRRHARSLHADAMVLRSNCAPVRGAAAIREFFFGALDAGLGEVEVEPCAWKSSEISHTRRDDARRWFPASAANAAKSAASTCGCASARPIRMEIGGRLLVRRPDSRKPGIRRSPKRWRKNDHPAQG